VIQTQIAAEKKKRKACFRRTETAVLPHRVVDPITRSRVPQDSACVAQQKPLPGRGGTQPNGTGYLELARRAGAEQGNDQRGEGKPGQNINRGKMMIWRMADATTSSQALKWICRTGKDNKNRS